MPSNFKACPILPGTTAVEVEVKPIMLPLLAVTLKSVTLLTRLLPSIVHQPTRWHFHPIEQTELAKAADGIRKIAKKAEKRSVVRSVLYRGPTSV